VREGIRGWGILRQHRPQSPHCRRQVDGNSFSAPPIQHCEIWGAHSRCVFLVEVVWIMLGSTPSTIFLEKGRLYGRAAVFYRQAGARGRDDCGGLLSRRGHPADGTLQFRKDTYHLDEPVAAELHASLRWEAVAVATSRFDGPAIEARRRLTRQAAKAQPLPERNACSRWPEGWCRWPGGEMKRGTRWI
jgi:hypothetical protein